MNQGLAAELVSFSAPMRELLSAAMDVSGAPTTILLTGESGTGKELVARFIHRTSPRAALPCTVLSCTLFDATAAEAALAHGGTVVFDEVGALPFEAQGRLLTLLERPRLSRVIATTNRELSSGVLQGTFRADLFYRLDVFPLRVPPLRERREDLTALAEQLLHLHAQGLGRPALRLSGGALSSLAGHDFPGNVRELSNLLERAAVRAHAPVLEAADLGLGLVPLGGGLFPSHLPLELSQLERMAITEALRRTGGNRTHAARMLGLGLRTLRQKLNGVPARIAPELTGVPALLEEAP